MRDIQGVPKNALSECCWSHSAVAQSPFAGTPCVWKLIFWSFVTKTKQDQALPSNVDGRIWPHSAQFWLWFFSICTFFLGHPVCVFGFILAHWMLLSVVAVRCTVCAAQTISINDTAPVCHKLCGNGRKKLLSDWKNEIYLFAFHFSFLMWELLLGKWVVYKHYFRGEKLNTDDRHVSNLPTPILDTSI